jgi:hypothetical protein
MAGRRHLRFSSIFEELMCFLGQFVWVEDVIFVAMSQVIVIIYFLTGS